jgi:type III secretion protein V
LLSAMAAGLVVTRSAGENDAGHLGESIGRQMLAHPRALLMTGFISLLLSVVPGFPALVFVGIAVIAFLLARYAMSLAPTEAREKRSLKQATVGTHASVATGTSGSSALAQPLAIEVAASAIAKIDMDELQDALTQRAVERATALGIRLPEPALTVAKESISSAWQISIFDVPVATGATLDIAGIVQELDSVLNKHAERFIGVQEVTNLLDAAAEQYPALVREVLRQVPAQRIAEVLRNLLRENIPVRNLRDVLEALAEWSGRERDTGNLTEFVRIHLKRYITSRFANQQHQLYALVVDGSAEDAVRSALTETAVGVTAVLPPQKISALRNSLRAELARLEIANDGSGNAVLVVSVDVRRHLRQILEPVRPMLPVISYQELLPDVEIHPVGTVRLQKESA